MALELTSPAFGAGEAIPRRYACDGEGVSPPLAWEGVPDGTQSLVLLVEDPDAPSHTFVHWLVLGLPPTSTGLPEGASHGGLPAGAHQGQNDRLEADYTPPCPPSGRHRYVFRLFALDTTLEAQSGARVKADVEAAMTGHILATAELIGTYQREGR